jgi:hypothetical protein
MEVIYLMLIYWLLVTSNALIDKIRIAAGKPIDHALEYMIFIVACTISTIPILNNYSWLEIAIAAIIGSTVTRAAFFNFTLNIMRGLPWTYQSTTTTSGIDQTEHKIESMLGFKIYDWMISLFFVALYLVIIIFAHLN